MENQVVLAVLQLSGIGRKTVMNRLKIDRSSECSVDGISRILKDYPAKQAGSAEIEAAIKASGEIIAECGKMGIGICTYLDEDYPERFRHMNDSPAVLYYKGDLKKINSVPAVAIVGTREPLAYGKKAAYKMGEIFGRDGYCVVSGLAVGCDTEGHRGCLDSDGYTVAILGNSLDEIYPKSNTELGEEILEKGGCLLSEYPPHTKMFKNMLVERDRLQSALSDGVIVIETGNPGGSLHAVGRALEYGRPVACVAHSEKYNNEAKIQGNIMLVREKKAMELGSNEDIERFKAKMKEKSVAGETGGGDDSGDADGQMSLDDFISK